MEDFKITNDLLHYFEEAGQTLFYHPNQCIYFQGDTSNQLYVVKKGRVRVFFLDQEGQEMTVEIIENGRIFGESSFLDQTSRPTTVEAINEVELYACTLDSLIPYLTSSSLLTTTLFKLLIRNMNNLSLQLHNLYFLDRYQKVASFLLEQTTHPNIEKGITKNSIAYSHQEIAYCIGLSRGTVTRVLDALKKDNCIALQYKKVIIKDRIALEAYKNKR